MNKQVFQRGQRWISHSEAELGLGTVEEINGRQITVYFPASEEERVYSAENAPLSRVIYNVGDEIQNTEGKELLIEQSQEHNGCIIYLCKDADGEEVILHEIDLSSSGQYNKPQERLFSGQLDKNKRFELRIETLRYQGECHKFNHFGLAGPRVQLLPHQFYIASQVAKRHAPRVLLADEVGLGKTIEAGLIMHQQMHNGSVDRVLIVVPDSLIHQWLVELLRRFNLTFTIMDHERCEAICEEGDINPFETAQRILCPLSFLTNKPKYQALAKAAEWDLMIVDEAHHLYWSEEKVSPEYACIESLAAKIPSLLLLTATPEQLGVSSHFARLRLLDPDRYYDLNEFIAEQSGYQAINSLIERLLAVPKLSDVLADAALKQDLEVVLGNEFFADSDALSHDDIVDDLLDRHGTGRVLFRNTRDVVEGFASRKLHIHPLELPDVEIEHEFEFSIEEVLLPELLFNEEDDDDWLRVDPRVEWLEGWLAEHKTEKVLLICAKAQTAEQLHDYLNLRTNLRSSVFHEGLGLVARDRAAAYFSEEDGAQILVCSEIGSEGRNFQFAHRLILFDLPLNPDLLEQRIGRLDRIGQTETVNIHVPCIQNTAQQRLFRWYAEGLNAFTEVCPIGHSIYAQVKTELKAQLLSSDSDGDDEAEFESLLQKTQQLAAESTKALHEGRDLMLELNSCRKGAAQEVVDSLALAANPLELSRFMEKIFDQYGVEQQYHSQDSIVIKPTEHMQQEGFPGLPEDGLTATYNRKLALSREDFHFLTWEHPMVTGAMEQIINSEFGNTTFCTMKLPPLKAGTLVLEAIYTVYCPAPKKLQLQRYLPETMQRIVVGSNGMDMTNILKPEHISSRISFVKKAVALNIIQHAKDTINKLVEKADVCVKPYQETLLETAISEMKAGETAILNRLEALAGVNPNIRSAEIDNQKEKMQQLESYLQQAQMKLDAIRLVLITD